MLKPSCAWASSSAPPSRRSSVRQCSGWRRNGGRSGDNAPCVGLTLLLPGQPLFAPPSLDDHADTTWPFSLFLQPNNSQFSNCLLRNTRASPAPAIPKLRIRHGADPLLPKPTSPPVSPVFSDPDLAGAPR